MYGYGYIIFCIIALIIFLTSMGISLSIGYCPYCVTRDQCYRYCCCCKCYLECDEILPSMSSLNDPNVLHI